MVNSVQILHNPIPQTYYPGNSHLCSQTVMIRIEDDSHIHYTYNYQ